MRHDHAELAPEKTQTPRSRRALVFAIGVAVLVLVFGLSLAIGTVRIPLRDVVDILTGQPGQKDSWTYIILNFRLPKALTALLAGMALSAAGLQMQTMFRNPLADPFILGINSGASLGVALAILGLGAAGGFLLSGLSAAGDLSLAIAAALGASLVFAIILLVGRVVKNPTTMLIVGLMVGYATSAIVSLLIYFSAPERIQAYAIWSFGSFSGVTWSQMRVLAPVILVGILVIVFMPKALNALLLGEDYARTMGLNVKRTRFLILVSSSLLAGTVTAFCGPIGFIGVAVPHLSRNFLRTSNHKALIPMVCILGGIGALLADMIAQLPGSQYVLPINVVTSLFGAPFVLWVILRQKRGATSFAV